MDEEMERFCGDLLQSVREMKTATWACKTEYVEQPDGSARRIVTRADGTVEEDGVIPAERWAALNARAKAGLSQAEFAKSLGVSKRTLQEWEQGRKRPSGAARVLLGIVARHPEVLRDAPP
ncbi:putative transcriptional regulator [Methylomagnum ishizawai]|uniref:Putative transcriptional regulator n=1 Tax=Methylomagnum ishizawai TaxID=1760988 RepID=A0A1Y6CWJ3_9GAMM|nr:helix-turn-helix domain-containing protein [Methylomagnum ishizawai]SMF94626.1 putative transcriptional regulator [Methylomagnum ishizawai]